MSRIKSNDFKVVYGVFHVQDTRALEDKEGVDVDDEKVKEVVEDERGREFGEVTHVAYQRQGFEKEEERGWKRAQGVVEELLQKHGGWPLRRCKVLNIGGLAAQVSAWKVGNIMKLFTVKKGKKNK